MSNFIVSVGTELMYLSSDNNMPWEHGRKLQLSVLRQVLVFSDDICTNIMPIRGLRDATSYAFPSLLKMPSK